MGCKNKLHIVFQIDYLFYHLIINRLIIQIILRLINNKNICLLLR